MWSTLVNKLYDILVATKKDGNTLLTEVFKYDVEKFTGDPAAIISPSENENDYATNDENERVYAFTVRLYVNRDVKIRKAGETDRVMKTLVDSVLDDFDRYYNLSALGTDGSAIPGGAIAVPNGYIFINLFATPSTWGYSGREDEYRSVELNIRCRVRVSLSNITSN